MKIPAENRCNFAFADGRRCAMPMLPGHPAGLCFQHWQQVVAQNDDPRAFAEEIMMDLGNLNTPEAVNAAVTRLFTLALLHQVSPRHLSVLGYIAQILNTNVAQIQRAQIAARSEEAVKSEIQQLRREVRDLADAFAGGSALPRRATRRRRPVLSAPQVSELVPVTPNGSSANGNSSANGAASNGGPNKDGQ